MNATGKRTILLVEDEVIIAIAEKQQLEARGYNIIHTFSGERAIEIVCLKKEPVDLILMDIDLGTGMDGIDTAQVILKDVDIPVLFISSYDDKEIIDKAESVTSYGYVAKNAGDMVLFASIKMAFKLFESKQNLQKREKSLRESEARYRALFDNISSGVAIYDVKDNGNDFIFKDFNKAGEKIDGDRKEDILGKSVLEMRPGIREFGLFDVFKRVWETGIAEHHPVSLYKDCRLKKWYNNYVYKLPSGEIVAVFEDITERKQTEQALKINEEKYKVLFESLPVGITISDKNGKILENNQEAEELLGLTQEEINRRKIYSGEWNIIKPDGSLMQSEEYASVRALKENRIIRDVEMGIVKKTGETSWINVIAAPIPLEGYGVAIAYSDITERKQSEEKIHSLLKEKELILKEVHHRIKNNMNTIISLLRLQANTPKNASAKEILLDAASRVYSMQILYDKLYQSENKNQISIKEYFTFLINEIIDIFPQKEYVKIESRIEDIILNTKILSPLGIILNELITNAMKHAFTGCNNGLLTITTFEKEDTICIIFEDNGIGIPESISLRNSAGFGLQLIDLLADQINASIHIERVQGTKFVIEFKI